MQAPASGDKFMAPGSCSKRQQQRRSQRDGRAVRHRLSLWTLAVGLFIAGLLGPPVTAAADGAERGARRIVNPLPLLPRGQTLGVTRYGNGDLGLLSPAQRAHLDDAVAAGLGGYTLYVDWPDLEPEAGDYRFAALLDNLDALAGLGLHTYLNITIGDIGELHLPADLPAGARLDDAAVLGRFAALLDVLVPELGARGVFLLGLGNEIDARLDETEASERLAYATFVEHARARIAELAPDLRVAVTLTAPAMIANSPTVELMREVVDVIAFNYAPFSPDWFVLDGGQIRDDLRRVLQAAGPGPIVIQELTCPSAESMGASLQWQRDCFEILLDELRATPGFRFASIFTFEAFTPAHCDAVIALFAPLLADLPADFRRRFQDYLCAMAVIGADGQAYPAWAMVLEHLQLQRSLANRRRTVDPDRRPPRGRRP